MQISYGVPEETGVSIVRKVFSQYQTGHSIFADKNILLPEYVPDDILHREAEMEQLTHMLAPVLKGYSPNNIFIYGPVGTGKTITTKFVLKELFDIVKKNKKIGLIYINCKMKRVSDTEYRLLAQMLREFGVKVPDTGLSTNVLHRRLEMTAEDKKTIVVLDEVDTLIQKIGDGFLYSMLRAAGNMSLIGITNNLTWQNGLDMRVVSSLAQEEIVFKKYNANQLYDILKTRAEKAFDIKVSDSVISKCAALAAQEHGDARRALTLLKTAGELADRDGAPNIDESYVDAAEGKMNSDRVIESLKGQPRQAQAVFASILELSQKARTGAWKDDRVLSGDVYAKYRDFCRIAKMRELTQRRVCDLVKEIESLGMIETNVVSHGRHGRKTEIRISVDNSLLNKAKLILAEAGFV